jgi:hypothetical protein
LDARAILDESAIMKELERPAHGGRNLFRQVGDGLFGHKIGWHGFPPEGRRRDDDRLIPWREDSAPF